MSPENQWLEDVCRSKILLSSKDMLVFGGVRHFAPGKNGAWKLEDKKKSCWKLETFLC